ncbi:MAG: hypothetical protein JWM14_3444 [Chitinophagaceae bacterium]|nr:hypothetical protein [Chitinophagaceae bacterium]
MTFPLFSKIVSDLSILTGKKYFWWTLLLLLFFPLAVLVLFNHPSADDYCYVVSAFKQGYWEAQWSTYNNWTGRYTSTFLLDSGPLLYGSFVGYKMQNLILLVLTAVSGLYFVKTLMNKKDIDVSVIAVSVCVLFLYLVKMPTLTEGFYWLSGAITYQLANTATLVVIVIVLNLRKEYKLWKVITAFVLCFLICGSNETSMIELIYILCALMAFEYASARSIPKYYYALLVISLIGAAIIIFAPGNAIRSSYFHGEKNIINALILAGGVGLSRMQEWLQDILILLVLFLPFLKQTEVFSDNERKITPVILILYPFFIVGILIVGYFPAFWSVGFEPPLRTVNVLYWIFTFSCLHYAILLVTYIKQKGGVFVVVPQFVLWILVFIAFRDLAPQNNLRTASMDVVSGRAITYDREMEERYQAMERSKGNDVVFKPLTAMPKSIFCTDIESEHPEDWKNVCMADYFHLKSLNLTKSTE